jgi:hypothetical protein
MQIHAHKTGTMHALITAVARGYTYYIRGDVPAGRVNTFRDKFHERYLVDLTPHQRHQRHRQGLGNARLFLHPSYTEPTFSWWLLLTEGAHPARASEKGICNLTDKRQRLCFQGQYEAVLRPAPGATPRWTWRLTTPYYEDLSSQLQRAIRNRKDHKELEAVLRSIHRLPGFRGVRGQVMALRKLAEGEWRRVKAEDRCPYLPPIIQPYPRFKSYPTVALELVRDRMLAGKTPFAAEWRYQPEADPGQASEPPHPQEADHDDGRDEGAA